MKTMQTGIEEVFGKDSLSRVVSCKFHLLQGRNTHRNKVRNDTVKKSFTSVTCKLFEVDAGYMKIISIWIRDISTVLVQKIT